MDSKRVVGWQNLPKHIVLMIAGRSELRRLRAVCSSWRSSLPLPVSCKSHPLFSVKIPDIHIPGALRSGGLPPLRDLCLTLTERKIYYLEPLVNDSTSPKSWIVKLEEMPSGKMRFHNTLSDSDSRIKLQVTVDLVDCRVLLVGKEYGLSYNDRHSIGGKVVLSDDGMLCLLANTTLMHYKFGDEDWTMIDERKDDRSSYSDIIYHKQKFYVIFNTGKIIVIDSSLKVEVFASLACVGRIYIERDELFFVESSGDLFVLEKSYDWKDRTHGLCETYQDLRLVLFETYKLHADKKEWVEATDLGDQTFFIGNDCSFAISADQISGCGKSLIYCPDDAFESLGTGAPGSNVWVFDLKDNSSHRLRSLRRYSQLFWPIPLWLKPRQVKTAHFDSRFQRLNISEFPFF